MVSMRLPALAGGHEIELSHRWYNPFARSVGSSLLWISTLQDQVQSFLVTAIKLVKLDCAGLPKNGNLARSKLRIAFGEAVAR
jgi:hypothetical protein